MYILINMSDIVSDILSNKQYWMTINAELSISTRTIRTYWLLLLIINKVSRIMILWTNFNLRWIEKLLNDKFIFLFNH